MNSHIYEARCKFCGLTLNLDIFDEYVNLRGGMFGEIPDLIKLAACNRCADYREKRRKIGDRMAAHARLLEVELYGGRGTSKNADAARAAMRIIFETYIEHVCSFHLMETVRDAEFVEKLLERPGKWAQAFVTYERLVIAEKNK